MTKLLNIIIDVSGSMNEMGKIHLQRNLCRYATQTQLIDSDKYAAIDFQFYQWARTISKVGLQSNGDIPEFKAEGSSSLSVLSDFLSKNFSINMSSLILLLSDGNFPNSEISTFKNQLNMFPHCIIHTVSIGADADLLKLKKISTNNRVHISENIASAIDYIIFGTDEQLAAPESTAQILQFEPAKSKKPEEDWNA